MSRYSRADAIGTMHIEQAARYGKPATGVGGIDGHFILSVLHTGEAPEPEKVDVSAINGRASLDWEQALIEAARMRERAREWRP